MTEREELRALLREAFNTQLAMEIAYVNDEFSITRAERWERVRKWVGEQIKETARHD